LFEFEAKGFTGGLW